MSRTGRRSTVTWFYFARPYPMGHESIKTTTNIYSFWLESEEQIAKIADFYILTH